MFEIVALDTREGEREAILTELGDARRIGKERDGARLPLAPGPCAGESVLSLFSGQAGAAAVGQNRAGW